MMTALKFLETELENTKRALDTAAANLQYQKQPDMNEFRRIQMERAHWMEELKNVIKKIKGEA